MSQSQKQPLAARLRPTDYQAFIGQVHLLAAGKPLRQMLEGGPLHSMILWGPPGCGKTTLARLLAAKANARIEQLSAVLAGVKDVRDVVARAQAARAEQATVLFVDEVHRFNKSQQDAFLPHVEEGTLTLIGATTENPAFALNNALLSRTRVYVLKRLTEQELQQILQQAWEHMGTEYPALTMTTAALELLAQAADGDARRGLTLLEVVIAMAQAEQEAGPVTVAIVQQALQGSLRQFDNKGDIFYDQISALHKSVRGSAPDAALYWLCRMLDAGCDPLYLARRIVRIASEDIGNADPRGLELALNAWQVQERLGSPEGELALGQAVIYLACAAKSNAVYNAFNQAMADAKEQGSLEVPVHLRNAPTTLQKTLGHGKAYRYAHDEPNGYAAGEQYFPDKLAQRRYYYPVERGLEIKIAEKLQRLRDYDNQRR